MQKQTIAGFNPLQIGEEAVNASRQVWLATLGVAAVTRDWVQTDAVQQFKSLVKEGTIIESRAAMFVNDQIEGSMTRANDFWKQTRSTVESTVKQAADTAVAFAQKALPKALPKFELPIATKRAKAKTVVATRARKAAKTVKRAAKRAKR